MFTGLIEQRAVVCAQEQTGDSCRLLIQSPFEDLEVGESIAVNGVCLTALPHPGSDLLFDLSPETLAVTNLGALSAGDPVNLERAMKASLRFGGHYVSGHVDTTAQVYATRAMGEYLELELAGFARPHMLYLVHKGSITVEGVSLTINFVGQDSLRLILIPHTLSHTTLGLLKAGQLVNIEFDYLARIVAHQLQISGKLNCEEAL